ncbi:MAG: hypothetical protein AAB877_00080 [Patescibacteria group bacterium]
MDREVLSSELRDRQKKLEQLGQSSTFESERVHRTINGKDNEAKIRRLQKESRAILNLKMQDNRKRGRFFGDGKDF